MSRIEEPLACTYADAALNHLRDNLRATAEQRWAWLRGAMDFAAAHARRRAERGEVTLDTERHIWWSPLHERLWRDEHRLPRPEELPGNIGQ